MSDKPDFIAELHYLTTAEGGRATPIYTGYFPQVRFPFTDNQTGGKQTFLSKSVVYPGNSVVTEIRMLNNSHVIARLYEGLTLEIMEGGRIVATGKIVKVLNSSLSNLG